VLTAHYRDKDVSVIHIGEVVRPYGLKGIVIVRTYAEFPRNLKQNTRVFISLSETVCSQMVIEWVKPCPQKSEYRVKFQEIINRNQAEQITGKLFGISEDALEILPANEYYIYELIGYRIFSVAGEQLGIVEDVINNPGNDLLRVKNGKRGFLVPMVGEIIRSVDTQKREIFIELIDGLRE
jgi:16S rRNA processing protein RimM